MKSFRAILVIDFNAKSLKNVMEFDVAFKKLSKELCDAIADPIGGKEINISNHQAEVLLKQRRGKTGDLNGIIFKGTRGPNKNPKRARVCKHPNPTVQKRLYYTRTNMENRGFSVSEIQQELDAIIKSKIIV